MNTREKMIVEFTREGSSIKRNDMEFIFEAQYGRYFNYRSVLGRSGDRLSYIKESIICYQQLDLEKYDNAVVLIKMPSANPIDEKELNAFEMALRVHFGYADMLFGTLVEDFDGKTHWDAEVLLSLNKY